MAKVSGVYAQGKRWNVKATTNLGLTKRQAEVTLSFDDNKEAHMAQELLTRGVLMIREVEG